MSNHACFRDNIKKVTIRNYSFLTSIRKVWFIEVTCIQLFIFFRACLPYFMNSFRRFLQIKASDWNFDFFSSIKNNDIIKKLSKTLLSFIQRIFTWFRVSISSIYEVTILILTYEPSLYAKSIFQLLAIFNTLLIV